MRLPFNLLTQATDPSPEYLGIVPVPPKGNKLENPILVTDHKYAKSIHTCRADIVLRTHSTIKIVPGRP